MKRPTVEVPAEWFDTKIIFTSICAIIVAALFPSHWYIGLIFVAAEVGHYFDTMRIIRKLKEYGNE